jgi:tetratricopeptide (TPR) repeat protein
MVLKSSLFAALALTIVALTAPLRLFDADVGACKDAKAFSSEVDTGSRQENASNQKASAVRIEACTRAINSTGWRYDNLSWAYANRGDAYRIAGKTDLALADYDQSIRLEPNRSITFHNRGLAYQAKGDLDHAVADYSQAIDKWHLRKTSSKRDYLSHRAVAYTHRGDLMLAMADYTAAIRLVPHDSDLYFNRGQLFKATNDLDRAIADYSHAIAEFDASEHSLSDKRNYLSARSEAYQAKGEAKLALADFDQAAAIDATLGRATKARTRVADVAGR